MVEVTARLMRGPVYFAGETLKCTISLRNDTDRDQTLAWSGVQVYCHCVVDESRVLFHKERRSSRGSLSDGSYSVAHSSAGSSTAFNPSFGERGHPIMSTAPSILFCMLRLAPGETSTYSFQETIPESSPPSHTGGLVKYSYKLTIGTQRVNSTVQLLKIPFKVMTISDNISTGPLVRRSSFNGASNPKETELNNCTGMPVKGASFHSLPPISIPNENGSLQNGDTGSLNTFGTIPEDEEVLTSTTAPSEASDVLDLYLHRLDSLTSRRSLNSYMIANPQGKVARFCLLKNKFKLGEDIIGIFNFDEATVPCVQFSVSLQSEEITKEPHRLHRASNAPSSYIVTNSVSKCHEVCLHTSTTQMVLSVPLTITPAFATELVSLSWRLHFEFVTTTTEGTLRVTSFHDSQGTCEQSPADLPVSTMTWDLPITVYPTHPIQVARGLHLPALSSLII